MKRYIVTVAHYFVHFSSLLVSGARNAASECMQIWCLVCKDMPGVWNHMNEYMSGGFWWLVFNQASDE